MRTISRNFVNNMYKWSKGSIWGAYAKPSATKESIWWDCVAYMREMGGENITVRSRNCHFFTAMFTYNNGKNLCVIYPTRKEFYEITEEDC
jgi:hypothetical protein